MYRAEITVNNVLKHAAEFATVPECTNWITENQEYFPSGYVTNIVDITTARKKLKRFENAKARIDFGSAMMAEIVAINEERLELGLLTDAQFVAMLNDATLFKIERLLWNGSLTSAKALIDAMDDTHFNAAQKEYISNKIANFLLTLG
jgi:hypothetical protein